MAWWQGALALYLLGAAVTWLVLIARLARDAALRPDAASWDALRLAAIWPCSWSVLALVLLGEAIVLALRRRAGPTTEAEEGEGES